MTPQEWRFYTYALGYLSGRSGAGDGAQYLTTEPERWLAGYKHGKGDGVTHRLIEPPDDARVVEIPSGASIDKVKRAYVECVKAVELMPEDQGAFVHVSAAARLLYDAYDEWFHAAPDMELNVAVPADERFVGAMNRVFHYAGWTNTLRDLLQEAVAHYSRHGERAPERWINAIADSAKPYAADDAPKMPRPDVPYGALADVLTALDRIATRIPMKPFPDPGAHSLEAYAEAVRYAYTDCVNVARRVLREFPVEAFEKIVAAAKADSAPEVDLRERIATVPLCRHCGQPRSFHKQDGPADNVWCPKFGASGAVELWRDLGGFESDVASNVEIPK